MKAILKRFDDEHPSLWEEPEPDDEDASPPGPEKVEDGPGDSSSCGEDPGPVEEDPFTFMDA